MSHRLRVEPPGTAPSAHEPQAAPPGQAIVSPVFRPAPEILGLGEADLAARRATVEGLAGRLRLLNEVHRALAGPISLEALLELILERAFAVLHPEEGVILRRGA